jgi:diguanylate cyclase (GGDEF)-like protein
MSAEGEQLQIASVRGLFSRSANTYAGADLELARRFARVNWGIGTLIAFLIAPFFPPTHALGDIGWVVGLPGSLFAVGGYLYSLRRPQIVTYQSLYFASYVSLGQLALLQWLSGGRIAPYHEIYLFLIISTGLMHPPRRFAIYTLAVIAAGFAPAFYAPATARVGEIITEQTLWLGIGVFLLLLMRKIREQRVALKQAGDEAHQLARLDPLTGLGNRRAFDETLSRELEAARATGTRVSLLVADLNGFKRINDVYGHVAGDNCLREAAEAVRHAVRGADRCFRWGGDEFAVLVGQAAAGDAAALAGRVEAAVSDTCRGPDGRPLSVVCGHAEIDGTATPAEAVAAADAVLLSLKRREPGPLPHVTV